MPSRAASNVQRRANRQQRQKFANDTRRVGGRRLSIPLRSPKKVLKARGALPYTELDAEGAAATAGALHVGIVEFESRTFNRLNVIDLNPVQIHGTHLVDGDLQTIELKHLVRIAGLVFKRHVVLEPGAAATDHSHS